MRDVEAEHEKAGFAAASASAPGTFCEKAADLRGEVGIADRGLTRQVWQRDVTLSSRIWKRLAGGNESSKKLVSKREAIEEVRMTAPPGPGEPDFGVLDSRAPIVGGVQVLEVDGGRLESGDAVRPRAVRLKQ